MVYLRIKKGKPYNVICFNEKGRLSRDNLIEQLQDIDDCTNIKKIVSACICKDYLIPTEVEGAVTIKQIIKILKLFTIDTYFVKCEIAYLEGE